MILQTLYQNCVKEGVEFFNEFYVLDQLIAEVDGVKKSAGVVAYELATGEIHVFQAKSVIYASGGTGKFFKVTSNAHTLTGDGQAACYRRGLPLEDMEFFQFHPTGIWRMGILLTEGARGEGGILRNKDGERFMEKYAPVMKDLASRDVVSRSIYTEIREGRGCGPEGDHVYLDLTHLPPEQLDAKLPGHHRVRAHVPRHRALHGPDPDPADRALRHGRHPDQRRGRGAGRQHHRRPGPVRRRRGRLRLRARRQPPGHQLAARHQRLRTPLGHRRRRVRREDRLRRAAREPGARWSRTQVERLRDSTGTERVAELRRELQECMDANVMVFRTEQTIKTAVEKIAELRERYLNVSIQDKGKRFNTDLLEAVELGNLLDLAEVMAVSALARKESRGGHYREDFPNRDDVNFMRHTMAYREVGDDGTESIRLDYKPVVQTRYQPMERKY